MTVRHTWSCCPYIELSFRYVGSLIRCFGLATLQFELDLMFTANSLCLVETLTHIFINI